MSDHQEALLAYGRHRTGLVFAALDGLARALAIFTDGSLDETIYAAVRAQTLALRGQLDAACGCQSTGGARDDA
jgi:hypothetical protein